MFSSLTVSCKHYYPIQLSNQVVCHCVVYCGKIKVVNRKEKLNLFRQTVTPRGNLVEKCGEWQNWLAPDTRHRDRTHTLIFIIQTTHYFRFFIYGTFVCIYNVLFSISFLLHIVYVYMLDPLREIMSFVFNNLVKRLR